MEIAGGYRTKMKNLQNGSSIGVNSDTLLVIKLPDSQVLRIVSRSLFLAMVVLTLPCIGSILREFSASSDYYLSADSVDSNSVDVEILDSLLLDLANEGLIKKGDKAFFICSEMGSTIDNVQFLNANDIDWIMGSKLVQKSLLDDASFDLVFAFGYDDTEFLDRILKVGGVLITQLDDFLSAIQKQSNYKVVYLHKYSSTIVGTRKTSLTTTKRLLSKPRVEAKRAALSGLEDILLEPPRKPLLESKAYLEKFKYLPDLLGDSLGEYPRRVFIDVSSQDEKDSVFAWFNEKYPTRDTKFVIYSIEIVGEGEPNSLDVSNWLMENVKENEFVVMKAEAEEVEEMLRRGTISLVDELFLECRSQWQNQEGKKKSRRAYWECLALYGRLRDTGVAVHQWWS